MQAIGFWYGVNSTVLHLCNELAHMMKSSDKQQWIAASKSSQTKHANSNLQQIKNAKGIAPNKAAGRKGGIRCQGSKRG
jgi:hypothetical protein